MFNLANFFNKKTLLKIKHQLKELIIFLLIFTLVIWSVSLPLTSLIKDLKAAGGIEIMNVDDGGSPDVFLTSTTTAEAFIKITAFDTTAGSNTVDSVTVQLEPGMNCTMSQPPTCADSPFTTADLAAISTTTTSGISLWRDDGDGTFNSASDTLISSTTAAQASAWTTQTITDDWGSFTVSQTTFANLNLSVPTSFANKLTLFAAATPTQNIDASPLHKFMPRIPQYGINVTSASIADFPDNSGGMGLMPVVLGTEGSGDNMQNSAPLVISEIQIASSTPAVEFIEIYNKTGQSFDLIPSNGVANADAAIAGNLNLHIVDCTGGSCTGTTTNPTLTLTTNNDAGDDIAANGYFLIASTDWNTAHSAGYGLPDATYDASTLGMDENGGVYISASTTAEAMIIDRVGWGNQTLAVEGMAAVSPPANGSLERKAYPSSTPTSMTSGVDSSKGNGSDTNNNSGDFITRPAGGALPQTSNSATESDAIADTDRNIVLNEILYNTASSSSWIELYNASSTAISVNNYTMAVGTSTQTIYTLPNISLAVASFLTIYWNQSGTNDTDTSDGQGAVYTGNIAPMSVYGDDFTLKNDSAAIVDYVQVGGSGKAGEAAASSAGQWTTGDYKPGSEYNQSIARAGTTGDDHNTSGDWMNVSSPTPGYPNMGGDSTAPTAVTNVSLTDPDNDNYGLTGQDVQITFTPASISDTSFDRYEIYLLPAGTALNTAQHAVYSTLYGQYMWQGGTKAATYTFTGYNDESMKRDSAGSALSNGDYRAYVIAFDMAGNKSTAVSSAPATLASDAGGADANPPMIDHMPVWQAPMDVGLTIYARLGDDRTLTTAQLAYRTASPDTAWGNATSTCAQPAMVGSTGLYGCSVAWDVGWDENTTFYYYLRAVDDSGNDTYLGMYSTPTESVAQTNSINIDFIAAASWNDAGTTLDLSGTVFNDTGNPLQDAFVIIDGLAATAATTTASGTFSLPDNTMPDGTQMIRIIKDGYMEKITDTDNNSVFIRRDAAGLEFLLHSGYMSSSAGGSAGGNGVSWTAPQDGMPMAPTSIACSGDCSSVAAGETPIIVGFFNAMNSATIDDMDAGNAGSNIYLTSDGVTKISGLKVKYASGNNEARIYSSTALSPNTFYTVIITPNILDSNGNPIMSNRPSGNYEFSFNTMGDNSSMWGGGGNDYGSYGGGGVYMPPYVVGTNPTPGSYNIALNTSISVEFSEAMDPSVTSAVKLYRITSVSSWTGSQVSATATLDNTTKKIITLTPAAALDANAANDGWYEIRVMASAKSQMGIWMGNPGSCAGVSPDTCLANTTHYSSSFQVGSATDLTAPTVGGTYPANNDGITSGTAAVDVAIPAIEIGFSEAMNPSTINSQNITLKKGTVSVTGTLNYNPMDNSAKFMPGNALTANSVYTLTIVGSGSSGVADLSGNYLAANYIVSFKTGSADTASPQVMFASGDDYQIAVTYAEPMNTAGQTDTANWTTSVLNPANYYLNSLASDQACATPGSWSCSPTAQSPYNTVGGNQVSALSNITLTYDSVTQTVTLRGFDMCNGQAFASCASNAFQIFVDNATDKSNNTITDSGYRAGDPTHRNAVRAFLQNSAETYGMLGPGGGPGMMMGGGGPGGGGAGGGPGMDMGQMGMFSAGAFPMNGMAGQTSLYFIDIPVTKKLQDGMQVVLTFPTGFDVSSVAPDPYSPMNNDMNDRNGGTVAFDTSFGVSGIASTTAKTVTIQLDITTAAGNTLNTTAGPDGFIDFLHLDLKGIKNSSIPKDFGTSGYTVDIKTKSSDGATLETITTMPFFITEGGSNSLTVVINAADAGTISSTTSVFLGSPMTGPMEAVSTNYINDYATSTFSSLPSGEFMLFTDPFITVGATNYMGKPMPEPVHIGGSNSKTITLEKEGSGTVATVNVLLNGNFSTDQNSDGDNTDAGDADDIDIFANSPSGFRVKTLTDVGSSNPTTQLYLTEGAWMMGLGPAMPKGPMAGPPPMPDWMEPAMVNIAVGIESASGRNLDPDSDTTDAANGNSEPVLLNVASTNNFQTGDVVNFATGGAAATTTITSLVVNTSITVTPQGNWTTLPAADDTITSVRESSRGANDAKIHFDISSQTLKYIKGFVIDDNNNVIGNAEVYAYQPYGGFGGGGHTTTDTSGKFNLKVSSNGVWTVSAFKPGMPDAKEKSVEVKANNSGTDGNATADVYLNGSLISDADNDNAGTNPLRLMLKRPGYTISGKVLNASSTPAAYAPVWAYQPSGSGHADTMTDSSGNYILYVDAGTWRIEADAPGVGWLQYSPDVTISSASQSNINLRPDTNTTFYTISGAVSIDGSAQQYMPIRAVLFDSKGNQLGGGEYGGSTDANGQYALSAPEGIYRVGIWTPQYGEVELDYDQYANNPANLNLNAATTTANITIATADLQTISLQFTNGTASQTGFLNVEEVDFSGATPKPTGFHFFSNINGLNATSTIKLKGSAAGKYYFFDLYVSGYGFYLPDAASRDQTKDGIKVTDADRAVYFTLPDASSGMVNISGTIYEGTAQAGNELANAWVWIGNPNSAYHSGAQTDSNGAYTLTVPSLNGNYNLGADKPGYMSPRPTVISGAADSSGNDITLTASSLIVSGYVYTDSDSNGSYSGSTEAIPNAWIWAENTTTGNMSQAPADANGYYELGAVNGSWRVMAGADGYKENSYRINNTKTNVTVAGSSVGSINIALSSDNNWSMKTKTKPITPSSGGTIDDSSASASSTRVKITVPPNALGSDSSSGNISIQETSSVTETTSAEPLGGKGKTIAATDNSGNAITNLSDYIDVELVYYKADLDAMDIVDYSKLKNYTLSYWDNSLNNWVSLATARKAYYKTAAADTDWTLNGDSASQTGYQEFIDALAAGQGGGYYDFKLVFTAKSNHLTVFAPTGPPDSLLPSAPANLAQTAGSGSSVTLGWNAVSTNFDSTAITDLLAYEIYRSTDSATYTQLNSSDLATSTTSYSDSTTSAWTSYYYKVTAADDGGNETPLASSTAAQVCSNYSVDNGSVAANCTISCNSGYELSGTSCAVSSGGAVITNPGGGSSAGSSNTNTQETTAEQTAKTTLPEIIEQTAEAISEVTDSASQAAKEFAQMVVDIAKDAAEIVKANVNALLGKLGFKRDLAKEQVSVKKYVKMLIKDTSGVTADQQNTLTNFVAYGTETTLTLGEGERAGVINSYKSAFGQLPAAESDWNDAIKIANGRWPSQTSEQAELKAKATFKKIYLRQPDRSNPHDDAAVVVMAYGLRPAKRNLGSEAAAIKIFKNIYGYNPLSATDWDAVRAISYSGATR